MSIQPQSRNHASNRSVGQWLGLSGYVLVVLGPLLVLAGITVQALLDGNAEWLHLAIPAGRRTKLLLNSLRLALAVSGSAMFLGWVGAVALWRWQSRLTVPLVWFILPLVALPPYVQALAWLTLSSFLRNLMQPLGLSVVAPYGWTGTLWVEVATFAPLALGFCWLGLRSIDPELIEAGRVVHSDFRCLIRIALPLSAPALLTGGGILFLISFLDYGVPSLLQFNVYAMEILAEFSISNSPERAFLLTLPLFAIAVGVLVCLLEPLRALTLRQVLFRPIWTSPPRWPKWLVGLQWVVCGMLIIQALLPVFTLAFLSNNPKQLASAVIQAHAKVGFSLWTAALAALLSLPIAFAAAQVLVRAGNAGRLVWFLVITPLAMPASLVGIGLIALSNRPFLQGRFVINLMPALASVARFAPLAALVILAQLRRTDRLLFDAALVFQPAWWRRQLQITAPLLAPGLLAGGGIVFAFSMGELGATLMVAPPGQATLTMRIYNYLHYGASDVVAGLCLVLAAGVLIAGGVAAIGGALWSRFFDYPEGKS